MKRVWIVYNKAGDSVYSGSDIVKAAAEADKAAGSMIVSFMTDDNGKLPNKITHNAGQVELSTRPAEKISKAEK